MTATTEHTPDYPPKTPPPPKRPPSPPRPETLLPDALAHGAAPGPGRVLSRSGRRGVTMANRRGANWVLEAAPWTAGKARTAVAGKLDKWGYQLGGDTAGAVDTVVTLLVDTAATIPGTCITVHLSDQDRQVCVLTLSHQTGLTPGAVEGGEDVLHRLTAVQAVTGCGTDAGPDGRRTWAVLDL